MGLLIEQLTCIKILKLVELKMLQMMNNVSFVIWLTPITS